MVFQIKRSLVRPYLRQWYGVVVETLRKPDRSRMGREYAVESLWISVFPAARADRARTAVSAL